MQSRRHLQQLVRRRQGHFKLAGDGAQAKALSLQFRHVLAGRPLWPGRAGAEAWTSLSRIDKVVSVGRGSATFARHAACA
jgi:hypothetical protein